MCFNANPKIGSLNKIYSMMTILSCGSVLDKIISDVKNCKNDIIKDVRWCAGCRDGRQSHDVFPWLLRPAAADPHGGDWSIE